MNSLRKLSLLLALIPSIAAPHEVENLLPAAQAMHALYHKVKHSFQLVDTQTRKQPMGDRQDAFTWYFDASEGTLYSCIGDSEPVFCTGREREERFAWSQTEMDYAKRQKLRPSDRWIDGPVYVLDAQPPFAQLTTFVWYVATNRVVRCRSTFTQYTFIVERRGEKIYIDNPRKAELSDKCETLFSK